jgi:hypothetical protein
MKDLEKKVTITLASTSYAGDGEWTDERELKWDQLSFGLTNHKVGQKEGSCYIPGKLSKPRRQNQNVEEIHLIVLDSDGGEDFESIKVSMDILHGLKCAIATTHSHLKTRTKIKRKEFEKSGLTPEQWLVQKKKMLPSIAEGAKIIARDEKTVTLSHKPCPRVTCIRD